MAANFNLIAPVYDLISGIVYGNKLTEAKLAFFKSLPEDCSILLMGGGTGNILNDLLEKKPGIRIDFIEPSSGMIRMAKRRLKKKFRSRINFICGDHRSIPLKQYDTITSFFVIDCFKQNEALEFAKTITASLHKNGYWLFADFFYTEKKSQRLLVALMYRFFKVVSNISATKLPDYDQLFSQLSFKMAEEKIFMKGLIRSRIYRRVQTL